jgi:GNAT superfamily N-acetyltransferase
MSGTSVRPAVPSDAGRIAELSGVLGYPAAAEAVAGRLERLLAQPDQVVLVAETAPGQVVGWVHGAEQELLESGRRCEIVGLVVDAGQRRVGAGRMLVTALEEWAAERGIEQMTVRSNVLRTESHPFYQRLGYVRTKTQHAYGKRLGGRSP